MYTLGFSKSNLSVEFHRLFLQRSARGPTKCLQLNNMLDFTSLTRTNRGLIFDPLAELLSVRKLDFRSLEPRPRRVAFHAVIQVFRYWPARFVLDLARVEQHAHLRLVLADCAHEGRSRRRVELWRTRKKSVELGRDFELQDAMCLIYVSQSRRTCRSLLVLVRSSPTAVATTTTGRRGDPCWCQGHPSWAGARSRNWGGALRKCPLIHTQTPQRLAQEPSETYQSPASRASGFFSPCCRTADEKWRWNSWECTLATELLAASDLENRRKETK